MTSVREMHLEDLFKFNSLVFDAQTEVYSLKLFLTHLLKWPELSQIAVAPGPEARPMGYIFGKHFKSKHNEWHGHVCALTVSDAYRRIGVATLLMAHIDRALDDKGALYVDLFLRQSNRAAHALYSSLGYVLRRTVLDYYCYDKPLPENAYDMRKPLASDVLRRSVAVTYTVPQCLSEDDEDDQ
ncbi:N-alpha-acetyltransferase 20 [Drosophila guanche]|uniref:N-alpha-acetyltransferase 20 n=1 Tax=Drosophila guanche TaxID=7266 RepID=A0A3B0JUG0_DROGU|nr:N-alpha-acetyltransferase 20 [Drosophila guanche]SPP85747.1 blast:N-alpha-acetyltransferase 20 [Drosophila guanche]